MDKARRREHWHKTRRLTGALLLLWLSTTFCAAFFARELTGLSIFGWPLSFYLAAQGASLVYLAIIGAYAWQMRRLDAGTRADAAAASSASIAPGAAVPGEPRR